MHDNDHVRSKSLIVTGGYAVITLELHALCYVLISMVMIIMPGSSWKDS